MDKLVFMCTHAAEEPERATIPFALATAAQAFDMEVIIGLQAEAVRLAVKGVAESIQAPGFPPLKELLDIYLSAGGQLLACSPCVNSRGLDPSRDFIAGVTVVGGGVFVKHFAEAKSALVY